MQINEKEFYRRGIFDKILDYKKSIFLIVATILGATILHLLFAQKIYLTQATVEVSPKSNQLGNSAKPQSGQSVFTRHLQTQMDLLQSRSMLLKVVTKLHSNIHYFEKRRFGYERVSQTLPVEIKYIKIKDPRFYDQMYKIKILNNNEYLLVPVDKKGLKSFRFRFAKLYKNRYFDIAIEKNHYSKAKELYFKVFDPKRYVDHVNENLSVYQNSENSSILKLDYSDTNPYSAKIFLNTLIDLFLDMKAKNEVAQAQDLLKLINSKLREEKVKLTKSENELKRYISKHKIARLNEQTDQTIGMIFSYKQKLETLNIRAQKLKMILAIYRQHYNYQDIMAMVQEIGNENLISYIDSIAQDDKQYRKMRLKYTIKHPDVQKMRKALVKKLKILDDNIEDLKKNVYVQQKQIKRYLGRYEKNLQGVPDRELGYTKLKRKYDLLEKHYLFLLDKKTQLLISKQVTGVYAYNVIDYAEIPPFPTKPKKKVLLMLSLIMGLMIGFLYALMRDYFSKYIKAPGELVELTQLPLLGIIPYIKNKKLYNTLFVIKSPEEVATQMMWALRTTIEDIVPKNSKKGLVIAVTSVIKGEGKTSIASNLALSFGMGDKRTVVVSMDTRLPELHVKFGVPNTIGITSVLFGDKSLEDVTYSSTQLKNFFIIPAGEHRHDPLAVINSNKINTIIEQLRENYDYIILDLPPVGVAPEAILLMKKSDLVISVLKANYSEKSFVTYMENIIKKHHLKNVGFLLNGVDKKYIQLLSRKENLKYIKSHARIIGKKESKKRFLWF